MYKHNKKRNIGLISEFFSRYMAFAFVDGRHSDIEKANSIWQKHINPSTETHREFVLFNALHEVSLKDRNVAHTLLRRLEAEIKKQSQKKLDKEKNALIVEINLSLKDPEFFGRSVEHYRDFASIQLLFNAWRGIGFKGTPADLAVLEESVIDIMLRDKPVVNESIADFSADEVDALVVRMMTEKFNRKYNQALNDEQKKIVQLYTLSQKDNSCKQNLQVLLESIREDTLGHIGALPVKESQSLRNKLAEIKAMLTEGGKYSDVTTVTDDAISFYMTVSKLKEEMESPE